MKYPGFLMLLLIIVSFYGAYPQIADEVIRMEAIEDFPVRTRDGTASNRKPYGPFNVEESIRALAGDDLNYTFHMAAAEGIFPGQAGTYTIRLNTLTERDGECVYNVYVNDEPVGLFQQNPSTNEFHAPATLRWNGVQIPANAKIRVESNNWSNLQRHELNFFEYARGRWTSIDFVPENNIDDTPKTTIGIFDAVEGVGLTNASERAVFHEVEDAYYLAAAKNEQDGSVPGLTYLWRPTAGNFELEALLGFIDFGGASGYEAGLMIRSSLDPGAPYLTCGVQGEGRVRLHYRAAEGAEIQKMESEVQAAEMLQLAREDDILTISLAKFGEDYVRHVIEMDGLDNRVFIGCYMQSNDDNGAIARFSRVRFFEELMGAGGK